MGARLDHIVAWMSFDVTLASDGRTFDSELPGKLAST